MNDFTYKSVYIPIEDGFTPDKAELERVGAEISQEIKLMTDYVTRAMLSGQQPRTFANGDGTFEHVWSYRHDLEGWPEEI